MTGVGERSELLEDREVARAADDRLGHAAIARELADLVLEVPPRSAVALYGAWGAGKTGIGRLLQSELAAKPGSHGFARFDAFKYADNPLRRSFISSVATELGFPKVPEFHENLYGSRTSTSVKIPKQWVLALVGVVMLYWFAIAAILAVLLAVIAIFQGGPFGDDWGKLVVTTLPVVGGPAAFIAAFFALTGKRFESVRTVSRPESDEEFEGCFKRLIDMTGRDRIVIFVDELDRCSPIEVIATLDAVRTFFGIEKCVFVVAADHQVLERALTKRTAAVAPLDPANPYYSSGSEYLDKVFPYQVTVFPMVVPQAVTSFAIELVRGRPGVWTEIGDNLDRIVSILIPAHVKSPRHVKNLLNAFVLAHRLTRARERDEFLELDEGTYAAELARLVCFRVEFPLFANDLVLDEQLPAYVLALSEKGEKAKEETWRDFPHARPGVRALAEGYAFKTRAVDDIRSDPIDSQVQAGSPGEEQRGETDSDRKALGEQRGEQLLEYLRRTRSVAGPTRSLLFLQGSGHTLGLPMSVAEGLERDAQNLSLQSLTATFSALSADEQLSAILFLAQVVRTAPGIEGENVAAAILTLYAEAVSELGASAAAICDNIEDPLVRNPELVSVDNVVGAWRLALSAHTTAAIHLGRLVLGSGLVRSVPELQRVVWAKLDRALEIDAHASEDLFLEFLGGDGSSHLIKSMLEAPLPAILDLLSRVEPALVTRLSTASEAEPAGLASTSSAPGAVADPDETLSEPAEPATNDRDVAIRALCDLALGVVDVLPVATERILRVLLQIDVKPGRDGAARILQVLKEVRLPETPSAVLAAVRRRSISEWPSWLRPLGLGDLPQDGLAPGVEGAATTLLTVGSKAPLPEKMSEIRQAAALLGAIVEKMSLQERVAVRAGIVRVRVVPKSDEDVTANAARIAALEEFVAAGLVEREDLIRGEEQAVLGALELPAIDATQVAPLAAFVFGSLRSVVLASASDGSPVASVTDCRALLSGTRASAWMPPSMKTALEMILRAHARIPREEWTDPQIDTPNMRLVIADLPRTLVPALAQAWLVIGPADVVPAWGLLAELLPTGVDPAVTKAARDWVAGLSVQNQRELLTFVVGSADAELPQPELLEALALDRCDANAVADVLVARASSSHNIPQKEGVLKVWAKAQPRDERARLRLFKEVLLPICVSSTTGLSKAWRYFDYIVAPKPPSGMVRRFYEEIVAAAANHPDEARIHAALGHAGYDMKRARLFGPKRAEPPSEER